MLSACTVQIPNTRICSVAGILSGGAYCAHTLTPETEDLTLTQFIEFLEPQDSHGAALCTASEDFAKLQAALEQACRKLGTSCSKDLKERVLEVSSRVTELTRRASKKVKTNP